MKSVKIEMYNAEVKLFNSPDDLRRWMRKNCDKESAEVMYEHSECVEGMAGSINTNDGRGYWFILLVSLDLVTLCHESLHVAYGLLEHIGVEHDAQNHEALCYLQHHLFEKAGKAYGLL